MWMLDHIRLSLSRIALQNLETCVNDTISSKFSFAGLDGVVAKSKIVQSTSGWRSSIVFAFPLLLLIRQQLSHMNFL